MNWLDLWKYSWKKKELFSLVKKSRKRVEAWKVKQLIQMKNEAQILYELVGNSVLHQGNEWSSYPCSKLSCEHARDTKILVETQMTGVETDTSITRKDLWYICGQTR